MASFIQYSNCSLYQQCSVVSNMPKMHWRRGLRPGPSWGAHDAPPYPLVGWGWGHSLSDLHTFRRLDSRAFGAQLLCSQCKILTTPVDWLPPGYVLTQHLCGRLATSHRNYWLDLHETDRILEVFHIFFFRPGNFLKDSSSLQKSIFPQFCLGLYIWKLIELPLVIKPGHGQYRVLSLMLRYNDWRRVGTSVCKRQHNNSLHLLKTNNTHAIGTKIRKVRRYWHVLGYARRLHCSCIVYI